MATLKQRMHKKNSSGTYDTVHLETSSSLVLRPSGRTVEQDLADYLPKTQASDTPPSTLKTGLMVTGDSKLWIGIKDLPMEVQLEMGNTTNIVTVTQIPNNQYGYRVQLLDTDGSPLKDVVIKGIDDPNTEIRTNSEGIVQFYSSKSSFTGLTYSGFPSYLDASMFPKAMQGYINDTSVVIVNPDISSYYGYDILVTNQDGVAVPNLILFDTSGTMMGTTDSTGHAKMYRQASSITFKNDKGTRGYYLNNTVVNGAKGSLVSATIIVSPYYGKLTLGQTIKYCEKDWILCHIDSKKHYLAASNIYEKTVFSNGSTTYAGSTLANRALVYQNNLIDTYDAYATDYLSDVTVNGVTAKVFVASYEQMNGGFSYFNSNSRRICKYDGEAAWYWTSSPYGGGVWGVGTGGSLSDYSPSGTGGFRPFVCLSL